MHRNNPTSAIPPCPELPHKKRLKRTTSNLIERRPVCFGLGLAKSLKNLNTALFHHLGKARFRQHLTDGAQVSNRVMLDAFACLSYKTRHSQYDKANLLPRRWQKALHLASHTGFTMSTVCRTTWTQVLKYILVGYSGLYHPTPNCSHDLA